MWGMSLHGPRPELRGSREHQAALSRAVKLFWGDESEQTAGLDHEESRLSPGQ